MNNIAVNLKKLRMEKSWTQQEMADKLFVTRQAVSNWENGKTEPDADMLIKISDVLGVDINEILYNKSKSGADSQKKTKKQADKILVLYIILFTVSLFFRITLPAIDNAIMYSGPVSDALKLKLDLYWKLSEYLMPGYAVSVGLTELTAAAISVRFVKSRFAVNNNTIRKAFSVMHYILLFFITLHFTSMFLGWVNNPVFIDANQFLNSLLPEPARKLKTFLQYSALYSHRRWHFAVIGAVYEITRPNKSKNNNLSEKTPVCE